MSANRKQLLDSHAISIACIVPVYNEHVIIKKFTTALQEKMASITNNYKIILIDDGSDIETKQQLQEIATHSNFALITLSRNFGKEAALTAGIDHCQQDLAILIDGDFQHPIDLIPEFLRYWTEGYEMVYGVRDSRHNENWLKRTCSQAFYRFMHVFTHVTIPQNAGDFRLLDKKVISALQRCEERNRFMKGLYAWVGYRTKGIPFSVAERVAGKSSWHFKSLTELAITGITSFTSIPLRIWSFVGFIISGCSFIFALFIILKTMVFGVDIPGYATLIVAVVFLSGIQLLSIGIVGEYIAKIFAEVKKRPQYLIADKTGMDDFS